MNRDQRKQAEALLLKACRAHGIETRQNEVQAALNDSNCGPSFVKWANEHLGADTLLTADELDSYLALDKSGRVDQLADSHDLAEVQAVTEDDLRAAIGELKQSTETISKQTETLRQQQDAISRLMKKHGENAARREELESVQRRKTEFEQSRLSKEVEQLSQNINLGLTEFAQQGPALNDEIEAALQSDDKLLMSLQKLGRELDQPDPNEAQAIEKLRETCTRLIKATVETVRAKLDMVYLDNLVSAERSGHVQPATDEEVKELQEEVESLYSEILSVAQMSVEQQHLEPALQAIAAKTGQSLSKTTTSLEYINECLVYLLERMNRLHTEVASRKSHEAASTALFSIAKAELAADAGPVSKASRPAFPLSPVKRLDGRSHVSSRGEPLDIEERSPIEKLLRDLSVSLPDCDNVPKEQAAALAGILAQRSHKTFEVSKGSQESFENSFKAQIDDAKQATQLLRDSLLAESPYDEMKLVDPDIEDSIMVLGQEINKANEKLNFIELQNVACQSGKKEDFCQRWGG